MLFQPDQIIWSKVFLFNLKLLKVGELTTSLGKLVHIGDIQLVK